ncbi:flagellar hook-basal body complex protein [Sphingomonas sp. NPDC092331]|jgi:flagellar hook protein FlgE|uniref:flagellar hook-basal body complex protein n=1 Tax=unclassified Sphingomonas TaxID=196159 RepID=UPI0029EC75BF|nr:flagellar hook-basal body complex protein [Pseudomonadota bacterium]
MFGAIYIGLSGLNAYSRGLEQVSNNVTNLNTSGFRGSTVTFQNYYGSGSQGGLSHDTDSNGGGNGVGIGQSRLDLSAGQLRQTGRDLDLAIDGGGFLVLMDGDKMLYARTGSFEVDNKGFIVLSGTSYRLATLDSSGRPVSLSIDQKRTSAPLGSTTITFTDNLSNTAVNAVTINDMVVYDAKGGSHKWSAKFEKGTVAGEWTVKISDEKGSVATKNLKFIGSVVDPSTAKIEVEDTTNNFKVTLDFSAVQSYSSGDVSNLRASSIDGHGVGALTTVTVNATGHLELAYSNEQKLDLGAVALADFRDTQSLLEKDGGLFTYNGSGERIYLASEDPRVGLVKAKQLEASNVDLSKQFGDLILIQRGFQASSQIVSVSNDMIQQLFGIRGQG